MNTTQHRAVPKDFDFRKLTSPWDLDVQQNWTVEGFLPAEAVTMISGESGSGKSTITLLLADAIANGKPFLGHETTPSTVLIVDRENGAVIYKERFERLRLEKNPNIIYWGGWEQTMEPQGPDFSPIIEFARTEKPVVIFDSFIAFLEGSEQDASEVRKYMDGYRRLAQAGATVIFIHHTGKGENTKEYRGSSDIKASVDMAYVLTTKKDRLALAKLKNIKSREGVVEDMLFSLDDAELVLLDQSFIETTDIDWQRVVDVVALNPGLNQSQIIKLLPNSSAPHIRKILMAGEMKSVFSVSKGLKNASQYFLSEPKTAQ